MPRKVCPTEADCPYNFWRSSTDINPSWDSIFSNLQTTIPWQGDPPMARPGRWAYPDMVMTMVIGSRCQIWYYLAQILPPHLTPTHTHTYAHRHTHRHTDTHSRLTFILSMYAFHL
jgi:hypothetical protein